jgi:hypothetical protein
LGNFDWKQHFLLQKIPPIATPRLTHYPLKGFLYEIFNNFGRKIGDVWRGWGMIYFMVGLGIIT